MADRVLRGSRLGSVSYENERSQAPAPRIRVGFDCLRGHHFEIPFAEEADLPGRWDCPTCGAPSEATNAVPAEPKPTKPVRTHWDMLLERRSTAELQILLDERLAEVRGDAGSTRTRRKSA
jgi:hypothetical protein